MKITTRSILLVLPALCLFAGASLATGVLDTQAERIAEFKPHEMDGPFELRVECCSAEQARTRAQRKGGTFVGPAGYVVRADTPLDLI